MFCVIYTSLKTSLKMTPIGGRNMENATLHTRTNLHIRIWIGFPSFSQGVQRVLDSE
jgi:hypothetical protein